MKMSLSWGKNFFTASYLTENSSTMSTQALDEWWQNELKGTRYYDRTTQHTACL